MEKVVFLEIVVKSQSQNNFPEFLGPEVLGLAQQLKMKLQSNPQPRHDQDLAMVAKSEHDGIQVFTNRIVFFQNFVPNKTPDWDGALAQIQNRFQPLFKKLAELSGPRWHQLQAQIHYPFKREAKGLLVGTKLLAKEYLPQLALNKFHLFAGREIAGYQVNLQLNGYDTHNFNVPKELRGKVQVQLSEASVQESGLQATLTVGNLQPELVGLTELLNRSSDAAEQIPEDFMGQYQGMFPVRPQGVSN